MGHGRKGVLIQRSKNNGVIPGSSYIGRIPNKVSVIETPVLIPSHAVEVAQGMSAEQLAHVIFSPKSGQGLKRNSY